MTPDVNVLVAASRTNQPHHAVARDWLEEAVSADGSGAAFTLMPMVLASDLRLVTSPKIVQLATPIEHAVALVDALQASPGVRLASLGPGWSTLRQLHLDKQRGGNHIPDAWLSAAVMHMGEHLVSFDRDFGKLLARGQFTLLAPAWPLASTAAGTRVRCEVAARTHGTGHRQSLVKSSLLAFQQGGLEHQHFVRIAS
jgi:toxin-antitoxin system PIN domain toxin